MRRRRLRAAVSAVWVCAAVGVLAGCSHEPDQAASQKAASGVVLSQAQRKHIHLYTVTRKSYQPVLHVTGTVDYDRHQATQILAPISGLVTQVQVAMGDTVKKGQVLARVDSADYAQAIGAYRQALAEARSDRRLADQAQDLLKHQGISAKDAAAAQSEALAAEADRDAALRKLESLNVPQATIEAIGQGRPVKASGGVIRAPIAGTVVARAITPGQHIQAGSTPCFTVADLSRMWVEARLFGADMRAVRPGDTAQVEPDDGGDPLPGKVTAVSAAVDTATGAATARVEVANPHRVLRKQMYVRVAIDTGRPASGLLVPVSAVLRDADNRPFVYVARKQDRFVRRHVTLGYRTGQDVVVTAGLTPGQKVVSEGGIFLRFMQSQ